MMSKAHKVSSALASAFIVYSAAPSAHAGECVNDWPNPDDCFPDVLCAQYSKYWTLRRAVVHLYGPDIGGTGVLINNANCAHSDKSCGAPYLLTANHVVSGSYNAEMTAGQMNDIQTLTTFTFGLEAATCGGLTAGGAVALEGATIIAHSPEKDLLLLRLSTSLPPELGAFFAGWCEGSLAQAVSISHPCGAPKRVAVSEPYEIEPAATVHRHVYDVNWWQDGALASGSSGAPLFEEQTGDLIGIFTDALQAGSLACSEPNGTPAQDRFTALPSILEVLPTIVDGGFTCIGPYDSDAYAPVAGTVENSEYYGPGEAKVISATEEVWLVDGFFADKGSTITIEIQP